MGENWNKELIFRLTADVTDWMGQPARTGQYKADKMETVDHQTLSLLYTIYCMADGLCGCMAECSMMKTIRWKIIDKELLHMGMNVRILNSIQFSFSFSCFSIPFPFNVELGKSMDDDDEEYLKINGERYNCSSPDPDIDKWKSGPVSQSLLSSHLPYTIYNSINGDLIPKNNLSIQSIICF